MTTLAEAAAVKEVIERHLPFGTRLILASDDLLDKWGTRTEDGLRITLDWGTQWPEGWYTPVLTTHDGPRISDYERVAEALDGLLRTLHALETIAPQTTVVGYETDDVEAVLAADAALRRLRGDR